MPNAMESDTPLDLRGNAAANIFDRCNRYTGHHYFLPRAFWFNTKFMTRCHHRHTNLQHDISSNSPHLSEQPHGFAPLESSQCAVTTYLRQQLTSRMRAALPTCLNGVLLKRRGYFTMHSYVITVSSNFQMLTVLVRKCAGTRPLQWLSTGG